MKDFDTERRERHAAREERMGDRAFTLGGETFNYRVTTSYMVLERVMDTENLEGVDVVRAFESAIVDMLEPGQEERLLKVLHSTEDPFTFEDLNELCQWLTEAQVARPTLAPSPSGSGEGATETSSTEDSSSKLVEVSAA